MRKIFAVNKEKAEKQYRDIGFQSPKLNTVFYFNMNVAYMAENVTYVYWYSKARIVVRLKGWNNSEYKQGKM